MRIWKIDDGASHWVVAENDAQAFGLWFENLIKTEGAWPEMPDERPSIARLDDLDELTIQPFGDGQKIKATVNEWLMIHKVPAYIACSEF